MAELSSEARNLNWLVQNFSERVPGVNEAVVVSSDGLPIATSSGLDRDAADRFADLLSSRGWDREAFRTRAAVTFTSSFSKTVAPGLRIGYFVTPQALVASYDDQAVSTYISPSLLPQATVFELMNRGAFEPNLDRVRALLKTRKDAMLEALAAEMPDGTRWSSN